MKGVAVPASGGVSRSGLGRTLAIARRVVAVQATQPATALWRLFEVRVVQENFAGEGRGLDVGCGDGSLASLLFERLPGMHWKGLDVDERDVESARRIGPYEAVHLASAARIPEPDGSFDVVFANSALEHMAPLSEVLNEVARVLRPGGRFVFTVPVLAFRENLLWYRLLKRVKLSRAATAYVRHLDRRLGHVNYHSSDEWVQRLTDSGFRTTKVVPYLPKRELACWEALANATGGLAYLLAGGRQSPRQIQQRWGIDRPAKAWLGRLVYYLLLPAIVISSLGSARAGFSAAYIEAIKDSTR